ncbi:Olfactomedin-like protein 2A [Desmophyllum pertusum]|uniref:Olfactomedin-like protein 2A n=1 Tax=Desmophyllum pertusum TaxID=174260 RepID=A0A9W9YRG6_9CNID|nr:Olfactomedin-like protein 2A [Desmophyllum pertusum]
MYGGEKAIENSFILFFSTDINECDSNPCLNGGSCVDLVNEYNCSCEPGYNGSRCENDINECDSNPCLNGGSCLDLVNEYNCSCAPGYNGSRCENESCSRTIKTVGSPVTHTTNHGHVTQGAWMKDPLGIMGNDTIFTMASSHGRYLKEYQNMESLKSKSDSENSAYIIKYNLQTESKESSIYIGGYRARHNGYRSCGGSCGMDLAVDEQGLWVLFGSTSNNKRLSVSKLDVDKNSITQTWNLNTEKMNTMGNAFVACGVIYCINSYSKRSTTINFAYDTKTGKQWNPNIQFTNQYGYNTMVDYNPRERVLYAWDRGRLVTYSLTFEEH